MVEQAAQANGPGMSLDNAFALFVLMLVAQVPVLVTAIVAFIKSKQAMKENKEELQENTRLTQYGSTVAGKTAQKTQEAVEGLNKKLNGGIDDAIQKGIEPIRVALELHTAKDAADLAEIKGKFEELTKYAHDRNHDVLNAMQTLSMQNELILEKLKDKK